MLGIHSVNPVSLMFVYGTPAGVPWGELPFPRTALPGVAVISRSLKCVVSGVDEVLLSLLAERPTNVVMIP